MPRFIENDRSALVDHLKKLLQEADRAYFALAFVRQSGVNLLREAIQEFVARNGVLKIIFANDFGATEYSAVEELKALGAKLRFFEGTSFHSSEGLHLQEREEVSGSHRFIKPLSEWHRNGG